jgi:hypothetical protein
LRHQQPEPVLAEIPRVTSECLRSLARAVQFVLSMN